MELLTEEQLYRAKPRIMLAVHLQSWIIARGITQEEVAKACRIDRRTVYRWMANKNRMPRTVWPSLAQQFGEPLPHFVTPHIDPEGREFVQFRVQRREKWTTAFELWPQDVEHAPEE